MKLNVDLAGIVCALALIGCSCEHERSDALIDVETEQPSSEVVTEQANPVNKSEPNEHVSNGGPELPPGIADLEVENKLASIHETSHLGEDAETLSSKDSSVEASSDIRMEL